MTAPTVESTNEDDDSAADGPGGKLERKNSKNAAIQTELDGLQNPKGSAKAKKRSPLKKMLADKRASKREGKRVGVSLLRYQ
nr:hypothetical protein BaRGS_003904 [Batillaria attramentaria]